MVKLGTRAVLRLIEPGTTANCAFCEDPVKYRARKHLRQIICNVYLKKRWDHVEHYHEECYDLAGNPHGDPDRTRVYVNR